MSARPAALSLLARRDYTAHELRTRLRDRGHTPEAIENALADLQARGAVDDRRVAAAHVRTASVVKGRGRLRVARELEARGVPRPLAQEVLASLAADDEGASIRRILARKHWPAHPTLADRRRMFLHLLRRGFPADGIGRALGRGAGEPDDPAEE